MKRDGSRDQASASEHASEGTGHAKEGVTRRISTLGRPKLIGRDSDWPIARKSLRLCGRCTSLSGATTLSSAMTWFLDQQAGGIFANDHAIAKDDGTPLLNPNFRISWARALSEAFSTNPCPGKLATLNAHEMARWGAGPNNRASPTSLLIPLIRLKKPSLPTVPAPDGAQMLRCKC
jgi:hypothetical protein